MRTFAFCTFYPDCYSKFSLSLNTHVCRPLPVSQRSNYKMPKFSQILTNRVTLAAGSSVQTICVSRITGDVMAKTTVEIGATVTWQFIVSCSL